MSHTITKEQIEKRNQEIDSSEQQIAAADQVAANAIKLLTHEIKVLKTELECAQVDFGCAKHEVRRLITALELSQTENAELRQFVYSLGFDWYAIRARNTIMGWDANGSPEAYSFHAQNSECPRQEWGPNLAPSWIENAK